jgi:hypothetical protein
MSVCRMRIDALLLKLAGAVGWSKHGALYEFLSLDVRRASVATALGTNLKMEALTCISAPKPVQAFGSPCLAERIVGLEKCRDAFSERQNVPVRYRIVHTLSKNSVGNFYTFCLWRMAYFFKYLILKR